MISDDEQAYLRHVIANLQAAQAAWSSWSTHLATKYQLGTLDRISESGVIERSDPVDVPGDD